MANARIFSGTGDTLRMQISCRIVTNICTSEATPLERHAADTSCVNTALGAERGGYSERYWRTLSGFIFAGFASLHENLKHQTPSGVHGGSTR